MDLIRDEVKLEEQAAKSEIREVQGPDGLERKIGIAKFRFSLRFSPSLTWKLTMPTRRRNVSW